MAKSKSEPGPDRHVQEMAAAYIDKGWYPIPLHPRSKACKDDNWRTKIYEPADFGPNDNLGLRLVGRDDDRSVKLVSIDLDCSEAVAMAAAFLPQTTALWGRRSKTISQALYVSPFDKATELKDTRDKSMMVELRVDHHSMAPPSVHPEGEILLWIPGDVVVDSIEAPKVEPAELLRSAQLLATACLVARYYNPQHARHMWGLALAGVLCKLALTKPEVDRIVSSAARYVLDENLQDRLKEIETTFAKGVNNPLSGAKQLLEEMPDDGTHLLRSLDEIWGKAQRRQSGFIAKQNRDGSETILPREQKNIQRALEELNVSLTYNVFSNREYITRDGQTSRLNDVIANRIWLDIKTRFNFLPEKDFFRTVLEYEAVSHSFHPVLDYLQALKWDGKPRIDDWLVAYGKAAQTDFTREVGRIVLLAAVRRVVEPGCKFDEMLVLESPQGMDKSQSIQALCPDPTWFSDTIDLRSEAREVIEATGGKWIIEAAEVVGMRRGSVEHIKAFLSRQTDGPVRGAYKHFADEVPRQFIMIGTTNSAEYLKDEDNRRFWPIRVKRFDVLGIRRDRDQLWAEAWVRRDEPIRLDKRFWAVAKVQQDSRRVVGIWEELVEEKFGAANSRGDVLVSNREAWEMFGIQVSSTNKVSLDDSERLSRTMQKMGFYKTAFSRDGKTYKGWRRDSTQTYLDEV